MPFPNKIVDISSLILFRIGFGLLAIIDVINSWIYYHFMVDAYNPDKFQFKYYGFEWVVVFPEPFMSIFFISLALIALFILIGYRYTLSTALFFIGFSYLFLLEKAHYLNHGYLFCWISFILIFLPANRAFSLDAWINPKLIRQKIPFWSMAILPLMMGIVYFFGGIAKLNMDWLSGYPLNIWLSYKKDLWLIGPILQMKWTPFFMAYGGLLLDLTALFLLAWKRTRIWAFLAALFFHFTNLLVFSIGIFPFLSVLLTSMFFPSYFPRSFIYKLSSRFTIIRTFIEAWEKKDKQVIQKETLWQENPNNLPIIKFSLILLITLHCLLPLRHHLFNSKVPWSEEGHRYSWRMMLRNKIGTGKFILRNRDNGKEEVIHPRANLEAKQYRKMLTHPDMILQYAHHLAKEKSAIGQDVEVYADIKVSLNGRPYQQFIDSGIDLNLEEWKFFIHSTWIIPLDPQLKPK